MLFNTLAYARFFAVVFVGYWLVARYRTARITLLLAASYAFYAGWDWRFLPLILGSSSVDYVLGLRIDSETDPRRRKRWLIVTVACNLGLLGLFKYWNFGLETLDVATASVGVFGRETGLSARYALHVALPVGISFYTFESMSYVIDVYRRDMPACRSYPRYLLFVAFFPHLVAGPIVRPTTLLPQLEATPVLGRLEGSHGVFLIAAGLLKKVVIGDYLALNLVDRVFDRPQAFSALETLMGVYGYAAQIYCDFSGYTDIAIGCALLLGIRLNPNFESPYQATSLRDFWRRWHISLSTWLRDYLYIPLGGSRGGSIATYRNLVLTMVLGGLWHGASWNFVFWGLLHGLGLAAERAWSARRGSAGSSRAMRIVTGLATFHYVCLAWVFFRAASFGKARLVLEQLATGTTFHPNLPASVVAILAVAALTHLVPEEMYARAKDRFAALPTPAQAALLFAVAFVLREASTSAVVPFVYFQF